MYTVRSRARRPWFACEPRFGLLRVCTAWSALRLDPHQAPSTAHTRVSFFLQSVHICGGPCSVHRHCLLSAPSHHPHATPFPMTCPTAVPRLPAEPSPPCFRSRNRSCSALRRRDENVPRGQCTSLLFRPFFAVQTDVPPPRRILPHPTSNERSRSPLSIGALHFSRDDDFQGRTKIV